MGEEMAPRVWRKPIPQTRDRAQSRALVWLAGAVLVLGEGYWLYLFRRGSPGHLVWPAVVSVAFALFAWGSRSATAGAALVGGWICLILLTATFGRVFLPESALPPLLALFLLTLGATKLGRSRKEAIGVAERRAGRRASQVMANLGIAGIAGLGFVGGRWFVVACIAALVEATADTVSSEIGQAFGGRTALVTSLKEVPPGTDGGVSWMGTLAGVFAGGLVLAVACWSLELRVKEAAAAFAGGLVGLMFDSLLGATAERRGWIGNDWVNFSSTLVAAIVGFVLASFAESANAGL
jgi:uncharacterized protein (TIGR00297 family)